MEHNPINPNPMECNPIEHSTIGPYPIGPNSFMLKTFVSNLIGIYSIRPNDIDPNRIKPDYYLTQPLTPRNLCLLLALENFDPRRDKCSVSTEHHTIKIHHNV